MNLVQFFLILRARYKVFLATFLVIVLATLTFNLLQPKTYKATASLILNYKGVDSVTGLTLPAQMMPGYMPTQVDIVSSMTVAKKVVEDLKLDQGKDIQARYDEAGGKGPLNEWVAALLLKNLEVLPSRESSVLDVSYKGADPKFAADVANGFASAYQLTAIQLKVEPAKKAANYINDQIKVLQENFDTAQKKLSKFQQDNGITTADARVDGMDVENARLNELSAQLVQAQSQAIEASSRGSQAAGIKGGESPDVINNPLVSNLKASLGVAESKFAEVSQRLDKNHPQYLGAKAEVDKLRSDLNAQIQAASNSVGNSARIFQQRESEIRIAVERQKIRVLQLNRVRDELRVLRNEVESAQRAYESASQRFSQTNLEGQSNQSDIALLNPALAPATPYGPKVVMNTILAMFFGAFFGIAFSLMAERRDPRVRTEADLSIVAPKVIPLLGVMDWIESKPGKFDFLNVFAPRRKFIKVGSA